MAWCSLQKEIVQSEGKRRNSFERVETTLKRSQNTNHPHNYMKSFVVAGRECLILTPHHVLLEVQESTKATGRQSNPLTDSLSAHNALWLHVHLRRKQKHEWADMAWLCLSHIETTDWRFFYNKPGWLSA